MLEGQDLESLKLTELQNQLKKRGLDTKGRKVDLIARLRQVINHGNKTTTDDPCSSDEESSSVILKDETTSPSSAIDDDDDDDDSDSEKQKLNKVETILHKKRRLTDDEEKESDSNSDEARKQLKDEDIEYKNGKNHEFEIEKSTKKGRWESQQDEEKESKEKQIDTKRSINDEVSLMEKETVHYNSQNVILDLYTSDLNLSVTTNCLSASNKCNDALCFLWAGSRSNYGFQKGKICYEVRVTEIIECPQMPDWEKEKFGVRVGWSNLRSGLHLLQLGEFNDSCASTNTGKKISKVNDRLCEESYGESFGVTDILGCYIDFGDKFHESKIKISFTKNGRDFGQAFQLDKSNISNFTDEKQFVFYPHILIKNAKIECNFGQIEKSWSKIKTDYVFPKNVSLHERIRLESINEEKDCNVILLSGLTGSGKTTWAKKYMEQHATKCFKLINVEYVLSKMTIDGKLPKINGRNDGLMLRVNICLQKLIEIAAQHRRNYIIDHVNITRETQLKRQELFNGYHRIGVVIVSNDDALRTRIDKIEKAEGISIPSQWIQEEKAKFHFLQKSSSLEDVIYPELSYEEAKFLYDKAGHDNRDNINRNRNRNDHYNRFRSGECEDRDHNRQTSHEGSHLSSSDRYDNRSKGFYIDNNYRNGSNYPNYREGLNSYNQHSSFHEEMNHGPRRNTNQSNNEWREGYHQVQRDNFGSNTDGRNREGFHNGNLFNNRSSCYETQRNGDNRNTFQSDFNNFQHESQFNQYEDNSPYFGNNSGFGENQNNNNVNFNQQYDRQGFGSRTPIQPEQGSFQNPSPYSTFSLHNTLSNQNEQFSSQPIQQMLANNPNLSLPTQTNSLDSWLTLYNTAMNPQVNQQLPRQDTNSITQQWAQWLTTTQNQTIIQQQPQQNQLSETNAWYYQTYLTQLTAAQQQLVVPTASNTNDILKSTTNDNKSLF